MNYRETALVLDLDGAAMLGIVAKPERPRALGLVVVVGGPQYRAGSHRQFLLLSRSLAAAGYPVLRFDYRGMGDSDGEPRGFDAVQRDIAMAIQGLRGTCPEVQRVALWGLCDGASAALMYCGASGDPQVAGLCLLNPWVRSEASLSRTHLKHYYGARLLQRELWLKVLRGQFAWRASLAGAWRTLAAVLRPRRAGAVGAAAQDDAPFQTRMARAWRGFPGKILLVLSGEDYTAKEFADHATADADWQGLLALPGVHRVDVAQADHTFSQAPWRLAVEEATRAWMASLEQEEAG